MYNQYLLKSLVSRPSEILSAVKIPQYIFPKPVLDLSSSQKALNYISNPCLNVMAVINDFIDGLPNITFQQLPFSDTVCESGSDENKNSNNNSSIISSKVLNRFLSNISNKDILSIQSQNLINLIHQSLFNSNSNDSFVSNDLINSDSATKTQQQIQTFTTLTPKSIFIDSNSINSKNIKWLNLIENVINLQCRAQEKNGLKCLGRFTFPDLNPDQKSIEPKSDVRLIISKVMDTQRVSEFINALAISTINHEKHNNERISEESLFSSDSNIHSDTRSSFFESYKNSSSISKSLSSIANDEKITEKEKYGAIFSGITIDRLIGSVNIQHTGPSLNDDNVKLELEQIILEALSKILEKNLEDSIY